MASQRSSKVDSSYQYNHSEILVNSAASPGPINIDIGTSASAMVTEDDIYRDAEPMMHGTIQSNATDMDGHNLNASHPHASTFENVLNSNIYIAP